MAKLIWLYLSQYLMKWAHFFCKVAGMCCSFILSGQKLALHLEKLPIFQKHAIFSHVCLSFCQCCRLVSVPLLNSAFTLCNGTGSTNRQILCRFTCTCMRARAHVYVYAYMCIWNAYACTYTCTHTSVYVYTYTLVLVNVHAHAYTYTCTHTCVYVYTYTLVLVNVHAHAYT